MLIRFPGFSVSLQHAGNRRLALDASPEIIAVREIIFLAVVGNHFAVWVHEPDALDAVFLGIDVESVYPLLHILRIMGNIAREIIQKDESVFQLNAQYVGSLPGRVLKYDSSATCSKSLHIRT